MRNGLRSRTSAALDESYAQRRRRWLPSWPGKKFVVSSAETASEVVARIRSRVIVIGPAAKRAIVDAVKPTAGTSPPTTVATGQDTIKQFVGTLTFANMEMAATFTGVARSAFELALDYVHERKQGGAAIINHQSVQLRTFELWQKVEAARGLTHRVFNFNYSDNGPHLLASVTAKTYVTRTSFEVASEALQLMGGNGLTREYPIEKIMRDARASMIEDGENNILNLKGMRWLSRWYQDKHDIAV